MEENNDKESCKCECMKFLATKENTSTLHRLLRLQLKIIVPSKIFRKGSYAKFSSLQQ
jgi:hypothetical protein